MTLHPPRVTASPPAYIMTPHMVTSLLERELKRGSTELLILALLDERQRHGYEISQLIEERSDGTITFHTASLYPTLYRLEARGLIEGRWVERAGQRRRRYYRLTRAGRKSLEKQRSTWETFFMALDRVAGIRHV
jgi:PadR family transcriptional regulator